MPVPYTQSLYQNLKDQYYPQSAYDLPNYDTDDPEELIRRRRRRMLDPMLNMFPQQFQAPVPIQQSLGQDILGSISGPGGIGLGGGIIPGIISAIAKHYSKK